MGDEIKALIDKYHLFRQGDKVGTYQTKGINKAEFMREVGERKAEILAYFDAQEKAAKEKREREEATFESIPGVKELREARHQYGEWMVAFNRMMETGSSKMPAIEHKTPEEIAALEAQYPMAVFALEAQRRANTTSNYRLATIWTDTYQAILDGKDISAVKADHDARMGEYTKSVMFD